MNSPAFLFPRGQLPDVAYLDAALLTDAGRLRVMPAAFCADVPTEHLVYHGHLHAIFQYPTEELIAWLRAEIGSEKALEICAGNGCLGRALGVKMTDAYTHTRPEVAARIGALGQHPVSYGSDVARVEAVAAVRAWRPAVVFGAWVTQYAPLETVGVGNVWGVKERAIVSKVQTYIVIGNAATHESKAICALPHERLTFPWLVTRSLRPELNCIYVWRRAA